MRRRFPIGQLIGLLVVLIALPTTINDGIAGWAGWLGWISQGQWQVALSLLGALIAMVATLTQLYVFRNESAVRPGNASEAPASVKAKHDSAPQEARQEPGPREVSVAELPPPAATAFAEMMRRKRIADLVVARALAARDLREAFDAFIQTFLTRRAQYAAGMGGEELERAREEYGRLQRRAAAAYRAVREHYRRFLADEPQYDRSSADWEDFVPEEPLPDWWRPITFDSALERYAHADDAHLRRLIAEERAILEAFAEWIAEPRHNALAGDLQGVELENGEILELIRHQLAQRQPARQQATLSARPGATSGREFADEYTFDVMNSGPSAAFQVKVWAARADGTRAATPVDLWTLPPDNRWNTVRVEIPRQFSDEGGLRLIVSWRDDSGEHEEALLDIRPLRQ
jgi:hypothetical protein